MDESVFVYVSDSKFLMDLIFQRWLIKTRDYLRCSLLCTLNPFTVLGHFKGRVIALTVQRHSESPGNITARCAPEEVTQFSTSITGDRAQILSCRVPGRGLLSSYAHIWKVSIFSGLVPINSGFSTLARLGVLTLQVSDVKCAYIRAF